MYIKQATVNNQVGLHARPATFFIQKANEFKSTIWVEKDEQRVNAKSLLGVLSLGIIKGNGTGKTSLLKAIARRADGINISPKAEIGYFEQTGYKFDARQSAISFMQDGCEYSMTEIRGILASMGIGPRDLTKDVGVLSGGEVIKLLLAKMLLGRYNILLMDEPGNYLDIKSAEALEQMMSAYAGTIVFVSHDKRLVENVADIVYEIKDTKLVKIFQRE